mgnify:FL=1
MGLHDHRVIGHDGGIFDRDDGIEDNYEFHWDEYKYCLGNKDGLDHKTEHGEAKSDAMESDKAAMNYPCGAIGRAEGSRDVLPTLNGQD